MTQLKIAEGLTLPLEAVTRKLAILAMSGAGKSNLAVVLAEGMFDAGIPWVAIDPKGDWWGVRSNKSGKGPGLPIPIFGGLHGDIPLEPTAGRLIGDLIVDQRLTCVLDVSEFPERQGMWGFLAEFGETLLKRNRQPLHLFLEEADEYLPQTSKDKGNLLRCLGIWQRVVKRGRFRGLGSTQISQRSASLNKDTLYQAEVLIAMRATGKGDRKAVEGWVEHHNAAAEIVASLSALGDGEGWVSSPAWLRLTKRVKFARRRTFDSGATPVLLESGAPAATLADVDLDVLRTRMAATIEKAKAEDPKELRKQIATLKADLAKASKGTMVVTAPAETKVEVKEIPALSPQQQRALEEAADRLSQAAGHALAQLRETFAEVQRMMSGITTTLDSARALVAQRPLVSRTTSRIQPALPAPRSAPRTPRATTRGALDRGERNGELGKSHRAVLGVLAQHPEGCDRRKLTLLAGYRWSGGFRNTLGDLRTFGYMVGGNEEVMQITDDGLAAIQGDWSPLPQGQELVDYWLRHPSLGKAERAILEVLTCHPGRGFSADELTEHTGYAWSGGFRNALGALRTAGLMVGSNTGRMQANEELFGS